MSEVLRYFEVYGDTEEEVLGLLHRELDEHGYKPRWGITVYPPNTDWQPGSVAGISGFSECWRATVSGEREDSLALCRELYALPVREVTKSTGQK